MMMTNYIYKCTRPSEVLPQDHKDCDICLNPHCGYSRCMEPNPKWEEQNTCKYEHCIENMPLQNPKGEESCPVFGHDCPGGVELAKECTEQNKAYKAKEDAILAELALKQVEE